MANDSLNAATGGEATAPTQPSLIAPPGGTGAKAAIPSPPPAAAMGPRPAPPCPRARWRLGLYKAALLLAGAALLADQAFLNHEGPYNFSFFYRERRKGNEIARAPGLVTATSAFAMLLAAALLAWPCSDSTTAAANPPTAAGSSASSKANAPTAAGSSASSEATPLTAAGSSESNEGSTSPLAPGPALLAAAVEAGLSVAMLALWIASLVMAALTAADVLRRTRVGSWSWWRCCNAGVLALVCGSVVAWVGILACSLRALVWALVRALAPGCSSCGAAAEHEPLLAAGKATSGSPACKEAGKTNLCSSIPSRQGGTCEPPTPPLQPARLALHAAAALLAIGVIVAQVVLMGHSAFVDDGDDYIYTAGKRVASNPALMAVTAVVTAVLTGALGALHWMTGTRRLWAASVSATPSLAAGGAAVELLGACALLGLWAACVSSSAETAARLQVQWSAVWMHSNRAALVLGCICAIVWGAAVAAAAWAFVVEGRAWWRRRLAEAEAAGIGKLREVWTVLLVVACLLAVGTLVTQGLFPCMHYQQLGWTTLAQLLAGASITLWCHWGGVGSFPALGLAQSEDPSVGQAATVLSMAMSALFLWVTSLSAEIEDVLRRTDGLDRCCSAAVLALQGANVMVWGSICTLAFWATARAFRALVFQVNACRSGYRQRDNAEEAADAAKASEPAKSNSQDEAPGITPATAAAPACGAWAGICGTRACVVEYLGPTGLYFLGLLLAIGVLVAQCVLVRHTERLDATDRIMEADWTALAPENPHGAFLDAVLNPWVSRQGIDIAHLPELVLATAAITIGAAAIWLLGAGLSAIWPGLRARVAASPLTRTCMDASEAWGGRLVRIMWIASGLASIQTAVALWEEPYRQSKVWFRCNTAVVALEAAMFLVWDAAVTQATWRLSRALRASPAAPVQQEAAATATAAAVSDADDVAGHVAGHDHDDLGWEVVAAKSEPRATPSTDAT